MIRVDNEIIEFKRFNDGSCRANLWNHNTVPVEPVVITWLYDNDEEVLQLYYVVKHLRSLGVNSIFLQMPYIVNARMDRVKKTSELFTLKYFCELINSLNFRMVEVYDPHSYVATALLNNVSVFYPTEEIQKLLKMYPEALLFFPDEGSMKRLHSQFETPYAFGVKQRNWETQKIESLQIAGAKHMIAGHDIIVCDDILSRGSTLYAAAKQLKDMGANNIYVWVSHCENTVLGPHIQGQSLLDIPNLITKVYTTNSIYLGNHPKVEVIKKF